MALPPPPKKPPFPPKKKKGEEEDESASPAPASAPAPAATGAKAPAESEGASASDSGDVAPYGNEDESSSDAPPDKMKGSKENPLRRWAATKADAAAQGLGARPAAASGPKQPVS